MNDNPTVAGGWLGTYHYNHVSMKPVRFEATFSSPDRTGRFPGRILDDNYLGEASVSGTQTNRLVVFTKRYLNAHKSTIQYEGRISDDGRIMTGSWRVRSITGTWEARRLWHEDVNEEREADPADAVAGRPLVVVGIYEL